MVHVVLYMAKLLQHSGNLSKLPIGYQTIKRELFHRQLLLQQRADLFDVQYLRDTGQLASQIDPRTRAQTLAYTGDCARRFSLHFLRFLQLRAEQTKSYSDPLQQRLGLLGRLCYSLVLVRLLYESLDDVHSSVRHIILCSIMI